MSERKFKMAKFKIRIFFETFSVCFIFEKIILTWIIDPSHLCIIFEKIGQNPGLEIVTLLEEKGE